MGRNLASSIRLPTASPCEWRCFSCSLAPEANPINPKGPPMLRIKNGRVIDPASGTDAMLDVWVEGDRITRVAPSTSGNAGGDAGSAAEIETLDATGLCVAPGFID